MFKLTNKHTVKWPVTIAKPIDGGKVEKHKLEVVFEILASDEYDRVAREGDVLERALIGIESQVLHEEGDVPLEFEVAKKWLLRIPYARAALLEAYFTASSGREAQQKN
jgi:hypothetical protein